MTTTMKRARKKLIGFFRYEPFPLGMLLMDMRHIQVRIGHAKAWWQSRVYLAVMRSLMRPFLDWFVKTLYVVREKHL